MGFYDSFKQGLYSELNPEAYQADQVRAAKRAEALAASNAYAQSVDPLIAQYGLGTKEFYDHLPDAAYRSGDMNMFDKIGQGYGLANQEAVLKPQADPMMTNSYKEFLLEQKDGYQGSFVDYQNMDANRKVARTSINMPEFKFPSTMIGIDSAKSIVDKNTGLNVSPGMSPDELNAGLASGKFAWGDSDKAGALQSLNLAESNLKQMYNLYLEATDGMSQDPGLMGTYERAKFSFQGDLMKEAQGKVKVYRDLAAAVAPALSQAMGQKGALSDGDVTRAQQLLSKLGGYSPSDLLDVDTRASATRKMNELMAIIQSAKQAKGGKPKQSRYHEYQDGLTGQWKVDRYYVPENGTEEILDEGFNIEGRL